MGGMIDLALHHPGDLVLSQEIDNGGDTHVHDLTLAPGRAIGTKRRQTVPVQGRGHRLTLHVAAAAVGPDLLRTVIGVRKALNGTAGIPNVDEDDQ